MNLETTTTTITMPVAIAPTVLMTAPCCQPFSRTRRWCLTMPACDSVKLVNTPTA